MEFILEESVENVALFFKPTSKCTKGLAFKIQTSTNTKI